MLYIREQDIKGLGIRWKDLIHVISKAIQSLSEGEFCQPIKPYVRFGKTANRIIAMPAFIGGAFNMAGIKWIASFPGNIEKGISRAHSVTILNDPITGVPICIINTSLISAIRTVSLSGFILHRFICAKASGEQLNVGIVGFGPIGKLHAEMIISTLGDRVRSLFVYDIKGVAAGSCSAAVKEKLVPVASWKEAYEDADIFVTATVSSDGYIDLRPRSGALLLNVSLRDFKPEISGFIDKMLVDDWEEVCRENTDIERMHLKCGLQKSDVYTLAGLSSNDPFEGLSSDSNVMFNPMGLAIFDIAVGGYYYNLARANHVGISLDSE
jgi:ornithine cyclodeaminase